MESSIIRRTVRVSGQVQGVGFRWAAADRAEQLGVSGTVRNLLDGTVEADVEGPEESVEQMLRWLGEGPSSARVSDTEVQEDSPRGLSDFRIV
ncbi:acylphosphatase [Brachybacterium endophyticum]|uniref:acylphosphatase n=1 Tax=Brachybacterium endophyticum TaxID=2182385 RepID=A0A2U2RGU9_9MICO|nr:acylphosphatase [Brachybacterium endophyticum]PWH05099.1 acylphosphatase [Brachybacterium endophyticum]